MAFQCLVDPDGEIAIAKALHSKGLAYTCSTMSTISLEEVAENSPGPNWFQLYVYKDRELTLELLRRAEASGYQGIMLTVDVPIMGKRERDWRNQFRLPKNLTAANFVLDKAKTLSEKTISSSIKAFTDSQFDASLTWKDVDWLKSKTSLPIILKGIMRPEDAEKAVHHGADVVVVSNHGGRQLDEVPSSIELLPTIANKVNGRIPVLIDGGIRRGVDIVKALALGADCVMIGRPLLWGLALSGEEGVIQVLSILCQELLETMILCGCCSTECLRSDKGLIANRSFKVSISKRSETFEEALC